MSTNGRRALAVCLYLLAAAACKPKYEFDPPEQEDRVAEAEGEYSPALFDTVTWTSDDRRATEGNAVFAAECRNCHGTTGGGGTDYAIQRELAVPSLVLPGWRYEGQLDSVRHKIFVGHAAGMPTWGIAGITPREIDGVAYYLLERLRPEMLSEGGAGR